MKTKILNCQNCSTTFTVPDTAKNSARAYCGAFCAKSANGKKNKGRKASPELRTHFSRIRMGEGNPFFGKKHTPETKDKISKILSRPITKPISLSYLHKQILDGLIIGDGHIAQINKHTARYAQACKYKEFLDHIQEVLPLNWGPICQDKKWHCYHIKSRFTPSLLIFRQRWYPKGKKIVPKDIILSKEVLLYWFLGDGSIRFPNRSKFPNSKHYEIKLATDSFSRKDNLFLISKLAEIGIESSLLGRNQIRIMARSNHKFFKLIGDSPIDCYKYKWRGLYEMNEKKKALIFGVSGQVS